MKKPKKQTICDVVIASNRTIRRNIRNTSEYWFDFCDGLANRTMLGFQISAIKAGLIQNKSDAINSEYAVVFNDYQNELSKDLRKTGIYQNYDSGLMYTIQTVEIALVYRKFYSAFTKGRVALVFRDMEKDTTFSEDTSLDELLKVKHLSLTIYLNKQNFDTKLVSNCVLQGKSEDETTKSFKLSDLINAFSA